MEAWRVARRALRRRPRARASAGFGAARAAAAARTRAPKRGRRRSEAEAAAAAAEPRRRAAELKAKLAANGGRRELELARDVEQRDRRAPGREQRVRRESPPVGLAGALAAARRPIETSPTRSSTASTPTAQASWNSRSSRGRSAIAARHAAGRSGAAARALQRRGGGRPAAERRRRPLKELLAKNATKVTQLFGAMDTGGAGHGRQVRVLREHVRGGDLRGGLADRGLDVVVVVVGVDPDGSGQLVLRGARRGAVPLGPSGNAARARPRARAARGRPAARAATSRWRPRGGGEARRECRAPVAQLFRDCATTGVVPSRPRPGRARARRRGSHGDDLRLARRATRSSTLHDVGSGSSLARRQGRRLRQCEAAGGRRADRRRDRLCGQVGPTSTTSHSSPMEQRSGARAAARSGATVAAARSAR